MALLHCLAKNAAALIAALAMLGSQAHVPSQAAPPSVRFSQSTTRVDAYDFVEISMDLEAPLARNPFMDAEVRGDFRVRGAAGSVPVQGFCDSKDGRRYAIRFMPRTPGDYSYVVSFRQGGDVQTHTGTFHASDGHRRGMVQVDPAYPWHFVWTGTGEHYFLNGTTAFLIMGWEDDRVITEALDRFARLKVNRVRILLNGRTDHWWTEPVQPGKGFTPCVNPWPAQRPKDPDNAGFDYTHFDVPFWNRFERMLRYARDRNIIISVIMDWNDSKEHPAAGGEDEQRYYRYAVARLGAFSNITWDLGDDLDSFRDEAWTHATGVRLTKWDIYHHLATSHPANSNEHQDRTSAWFGMASFQEWHRPLHPWMLEQRRTQAATGRIIPQVNEEYGYEDHYPDWNPVPAPGCSADSNRREAWEISMAGTYQTTGETAKRGTGVAPDTGGGWINGRADTTMLLLAMQSHMVDFFTSFEWWKTEPHDELVDRGALCLAELGTTYALYLPHGGQVTVKLEPGHYKATWYHARSGERLPIGEAAGPVWTSPKAPDLDDWAVLILKQQ